MAQLAAGDGAEGVEELMDYVLFPFKAVASLFYCLWGGLEEWKGVLIAQWRFLGYKHGKGCSIPYEQMLWQWDQTVEMPEVWDSVSFWHECWGVVKDISVWSDNTLRLDVRVASAPAQRYLRPHEIDKIVRRQNVEELT